MTATRRQTSHHARWRWPAVTGTQVLVAAFAVGSWAPSLHSQVPLEPRFAVASIRAVDDPSGRLNRVQVSGDRFRATTISLTQLVLRAYQLPTFRVVGLPSWAASVHFDIEAVADSEVHHDEMMRMLRTLLQDRLGLQARIDTRDMPVYKLVLARQDQQLGPGFRPSTLDCGAFRTALAEWDRSHIGERPRRAACEPS